MIHIDIKKPLHGSHGDMSLDINLSLQQGEFLALSGVSGSGKTTLLRVLAGLDDAKGEIRIGDKIWLNSKHTLPTQKREIGFVFQHYALFPNMTVENNLLFVKKNKTLAKYLLNVTELYELRDRLPSSLSGGQKQRIALCRAMMNKPKLLLLDEPLSALDPYMRAKLQDEILSLHQEFDTTTIMVSHDPSEIYRLASRVVTLEHGKVINDGKPKDILLRTSGSQKFSFEGILLEITRVDVMYIAIIAIGQQLVEVVISSSEAKNLKVGNKIRVATKAFAPTIML